ncbi:hypothetical protein SAMN05421786_101757 [Chryseobacterium ureilyticum]|uniref:Uncharacterized protein n=1 Tax=Chryseobacterium ureilyticum TaxID=373668 RepID=A0A1N7KUL5_9FLAO|nr:hypothetical protein [Chryseobacterium ureilyticum]SIS65254.1 hypothetical protein SAMN05421786_101757 [Chryseobacterium ureilyticum]
MKQLSLLLLLIFGFTSCQKQIDNSHSKLIINIAEAKYETIGFSDKYEVLPKLNIQEISEDAFNKLKITKNSFQQTPIKKNKGNYFLDINNKTLQLKGENDNETEKKQGGIWYNYLGFYPSLDMYAVSANSVSEGIDFSDFELINKSNGKIVKIVSPGDDKIENPVLSPQINYLAYFHNQIYDNNSFFGILKIDSNKDLREYKSLILENFKIYQVNWSDDHLILIKASTDGGKTFKYYRSDILSKNINQGLEEKEEWEGTYHSEAINRDNAKTVFDINIKSLDNISINIDDDGSKESYSNIKAETINKDKIKVIYNSSFEDDMGTIYIEKSDDKFYISGTPIYLINPGNNEMPLKKIK